ncbi:MAG: four helix bundle protein [Arenicella sp.]|jgi:four helix bundle protein
MKSMDLVVEVYSITKTLPESEKFNFTSQLNRCALSVPSNIAEGAGRNSKKDFQRFLNIATGSSYELETQLLLIKRIFKIETELIIENLKEVQRMIFALNKSLNT